MGDLNARSNEYMTLSIYEFLESLIDAVRPQETVRSSDQSIVNSEIIPGGHSEDIFIFLSDRERDEYSCEVCYNILKDAHQCVNGHKFCYSCIYVWSISERTAADSCPACRCEGIYARNDQINDRLNRKRVKCQTRECNWRGFLIDYNGHEHRTYDFRELKNSIDFPSNRSGVESLSNQQKLPSPLHNSERTVEETNVNASTRTGEPNNLENSTLLPSDSSINRTVQRAPLAPRRLERLGEANVRGNHPVSSRTNIFRNSSQTRPRLTGVSNTSRINFPVTNSGSLQNNSRNVPLSPNLNSTTDTSRSSIQLPAINHNGTITATARFSTNNELQYRRLAPTYAHRRRQLVEGREQLAMMLILLTSDMDSFGSRTNSNATVSSHSNAASVGATGVGSSPSTGVSQNRLTTSEDTFEDRQRLPPTSVYETRLSNRARLAEFRNLNRRLSEVADSLDRLIESTTNRRREGNSLESFSDLDDGDITDTDNI